MESQPVADSGRYFVGVSTKAYLGLSQTDAWLAAARAELDARPQLAVRGIRVFIIPSAPLILPAISALEGTGAWVGAQDAYWQGGAVTGAVPMTLVAELGATIVELGHAERRRIFGETDDDVARKLRACRESGLVPLLCIGELEQNDAATAGAECVRQVRAATSDDREAVAASILAYEPQWAIGASEPAAPDYVNEVMRLVRKGLADLLGAVPRAVIYGGSAGPGTFGPLVESDGLFLGRFAHDPRNFGLVLDEVLERAAMN